MENNNQILNNAVEIAREVARKNNPNLPEKKIVGRIKVPSKSGSVKNIGRVVGNKRKSVELSQDEISRRKEDYHLASEVIDAFNFLMKSKSKYTKFEYESLGGKRLNVEAFVDSENQPFAVIEHPTKHKHSDKLTILSIDKKGAFIKQDLEGYTQSEDYEVVKTIGQVIAAHEYKENEPVKSYGQILAEHRNSPAEYVTEDYRFQTSKKYMFNGEFFEHKKSLLEYLGLNNTKEVYSGMWDEKVSKILNERFGAKMESIRTQHNETEMGM